MPSRPEALSLKSRAKACDETADPAWKLQSPPALQRGVLQSSDGGRAVGEVMRVGDASKGRLNVVEAALCCWTSSRGPRPV